MSVSLQCHTAFNKSFGPFLTADVLKRAQTVNNITVKTKSFLWWTVVVLFKICKQILDGFSCNLIKMFPSG